jgi:hypothetical protein
MNGHNVTKDSDRHTGPKGVYKSGPRYTVVYRDASGTQRRQQTNTLAEARLLQVTLTRNAQPPGGSSRG